MRQPLTSGRQPSRTESAPRGRPDIARGEPRPSTVELNVEKPGQSVAKVSVSISAAEFKTEVQRGLKQAGRNISMKGFRPGKIPPAIVEKYHGEAVRQEVKQHFVQRAYQQAIDAKEKIIVGVNEFQQDEEIPLEVLRVNENAEREQIGRAHV